ncbi:MAG: hypothetical protein HQK52_18255 [Oligoflexia bacterium]|nr:hypothetical protein [Oligoflexia bacterium]
MSACSRKNSLLFFSIIIALIIALIAITKTMASDSVDLVMLEDSNGERGSYALLISHGLAYPIKCSAISDEYQVLEGLGFHFDTSSLKRVSLDDVEASKPHEQPLLCPKSADNEIELFQNDNTYYLRFKNTHPNDIYIAGCEELILSLNLSPAEAVVKDPTPFYEGHIFTIGCFRGNPVEELPKSFTEWCTKGDLTDAQKYTVQTLLRATTEGSTALGNASKCKKAENSLMKLKTLDLSGRGLTDIGPLNVFTNLISLILNNNKIQDLSPLSSLNGLVTLKLADNKISDVTPLSALPSLKELDLKNNTIVDTQIIASFGALEKLNLSGNKLTNLSLEGIANSESIKILDLSNNQISDPTPLHTMKLLSKVNLSNNQISRSDVASGFPATVEVEMDANPLDGNSFFAFCMAHKNDNAPIANTIKKMMGDKNCQGAEAELKTKTTLDLKDSDISDLTPLKFFPQIRVIDLSNNTLSDVSGLLVLRDLREVNLSNNNLQDISPLRELSKLTTIQIAGNTITIHDFPSWCLLSKMATDADTLVSAEEKKTVEAMLRATSSNSCFDAHRKLVRATTLDLSNKAISTLRPLSSLVYLRDLNLMGNALVDLSPLAALKQLTTLNLINNKIVSLEVIKSLPNLVTLFAGSNPVKNLFHLINHPTLTSLGLANTQVVELDALWSIPKLKNVALDGLQPHLGDFRDICILAKANFRTGLHSAFAESLLTYSAIYDLFRSANPAPSTAAENCTTALTWANTLTSLDLSGKNISDLTPLYLGGGAFKALTSLSVSNNRISDLSPVNALKQLKSLLAINNLISEIKEHTFEGVPLTYLNLGQNKITNGGSTAEIVKISTLKVLHLHDNLITGRFLTNTDINSSGLLRLPANMEIINLQNNKIDADSWKILRGHFPRLQTGGFHLFATRAKENLGQGKAVGLYIKGNAICNNVAGLTDINNDAALKEGMNRACNDKLPLFRIIRDTPPIRFPIPLHL